MKILCKYPTRGRPRHFIQRLKEWTGMAASPSELAWLVSYDEDDQTMTSNIIEEAQSIHREIFCVKGNSMSKIEACNKNISEYGADWNVIILVSDDFFCVRHGWDTMIRENMGRHFPDTDGALWFYDGAQRKINTLECVGRARYNKFGYLYHPDYFSFWCDNETTEVGLRDGKLVFIEQSIAHHHHPSWLGGMKKDATYMRNHGYWAKDQATYERRKAAGFPA